MQKLLRFQVENLGKLEKLHRSKNFHNILNNISFIFNCTSYFNRKKFIYLSYTLSYTLALTFSLTWNSAQWAHFNHLSILSFLYRICCLTSSGLNYFIFKILKTLTQSFSELGWKLLTKKSLTFLEIVFSSVTIACRN